MEPKKGPPGRARECNRAMHVYLGRICSEIVVHEADPPGVGGRSCDASRAVERQLAPSIPSFRANVCASKGARSLTSVLSKKQ